MDLVDPPAAPAATSTRPWQVTLAVTLVAVWWFGGVAALIPALLILGGVDSAIPALLTCGTWSVVVFFSLRSTWRGGRGTIGVVAYAYLIGVPFELAGIWMSISALVGSSPVPLWTSLLMMAIGGLPMTAGRLLTSPAAKAYAPRAAPG